MAELVRGWSFALGTLLFSILVIILGVGMAWRPQRFFPDNEAWGVAMGLVRDEKGMKEWRTESRLAGIVMSICGCLFLLLSARKFLPWMLHPVPLQLAPESQPGTPAWALLAFGLVLFPTGLWMSLKAEEFARHSLAVFPSRVRLVADSTLRFWTIVYRIGGILAMIFSFLPLSEWALRLHQ